MLSVTLLLDLLLLQLLSCGTVHTRDKKGETLAAVLVDAI